MSGPWCLDRKGSCGSVLRSDRKMGRSPMCSEFLAGKRELKRGDCGRGEGRDGRGCREDGGAKERRRMETVAVTRKRRAPWPAYCVAGHELRNSQSGHSRPFLFSVVCDLRSPPSISSPPALKRATTRPNHPKPASPILALSPPHSSNTQHKGRLYVRLMYLLHSALPPWSFGLNYLSSDAPSNFVRDLQQS